MTTNAILQVAPSEPAALRALGIVDSQIEPIWGADFAIVCGGELMLAAQRKTVADLLASTRDGRLYRQVRLLARSPNGVVVIEGYPRWTMDGLWADWPGRGPRWRVEAYWACVDAVQQAGLKLLQVADQAETASWLRYQLAHLSRR